MKKTVALFAALSVAMILAFAPAVQAQTTINTTTLSSAMTVRATVANVASASTIVVGQQLYIDTEVMVVTAINGTQLSVTRGMSATASTAHPSGRIVYSGPSNYFTRNTPQGSCATTDQLYYPVINTSTGEFSNCTGGLWQTTVMNPYEYASWPRTPVADKAYTIKTTDVIVSMTTLTAPRSLTLPTMTGQAPHNLIIIDESGSAGSQTITIVGTINGSTSNTIAAAYGVLRLFWTGTAWVKW